MGATIDRATIEKLSVEERLKLIDLIRETLEQETETFSPEVLAEMDRRLAAARANPDDGMSLEEFENRLRARWK